MSNKPKGDNFYQGVADVYQQRRADHLPVQSFIAKLHGVSLATAQQYIRRARKRGYLPPTTPGRASGPVTYRLSHQGEFGRLHLPAEITALFPDGTQFICEADGDTITYRRVT